MTTRGALAGFAVLWTATMLFSPIASGQGPPDGTGRITFEYLAYPDSTFTDAERQFQVCMVNRGGDGELVYDGVRNLDQVVVSIPMGTTEDDLTEQATIYCLPREPGWLCEGPDYQAGEALLTFRPDGTAEVGTEEEVCFKIEMVGVNVEVGLSFLRANQLIAPQRANPPANTQMGLYKAELPPIAHDDLVDVLADQHHVRYSGDEAFQAVLERDGPGSGLDADTVDGFEGGDLDQSAQVGSHEGRIAALEAEVAALMTLLAHFSRDENEIYITGANLHVVNGEGSTQSANSLGNLIIGYNELRPNPPNPGEFDPPLLVPPIDVRTGSHMLVVGEGLNYESHGGIVAGQYNHTTGSFSTVVGGLLNTASGENASVTGGLLNTAGGTYSSVSGGKKNEASGDESSVIGGYNNEASGETASVSGGIGSTASGDRSSVGGGAQCEASGYASSVSGGVGSTASGDRSSVGGGHGNTASGERAWAAGGRGNVASGSETSVIGGWGNEATHFTAAVIGGEYNKATWTGATVCGGYSNEASALFSTVSGGWHNAASGEWSSVSGGRMVTADEDYEWEPGMMEDDVDEKIAAHRSIAFAHHARYTDPEAFQAVLDRDGHSSGLDADMVDGLHGSGLDQSAGLAELVDRFQHFSRVDDEVYVTGANLHVLNGTGSTDGAPNGLGNLLIGYNEERTDDGDPSTSDTNTRTGSHLLVAGKGLNYSMYGGIVAGLRNDATGEFSSVTGGRYNRASGDGAAVSGGRFNIASGPRASVSGGRQNTASGENASISGGAANWAMENDSSVSGGSSNRAEALSSSILGGSQNRATSGGATVCGGHQNLASGAQASVSGGYLNVASSTGAVVSGGKENKARGSQSVVSGGVGIVTLPYPGEWEPGVTEAEVDQKITDHTAIPDAHHPAGLSEEEVDQKITDHSAVPDAHHGRYTDDEAFQAVLDRDGHGSGLDADMVDGLHGSGLDQSAGVAELVDRFQHFSRTDDEVFITGANLHVVNGAGTTDGTPNALGNVIVGYNEGRTDDGVAETDDTNVRTGSHMLVVGRALNYSQYGGIVVGERNTAGGAYASVGGGRNNEATGTGSWVSAGWRNKASGTGSSVNGGRSNQAIGEASCVSAGWVNRASGHSSSVNGGTGNTASDAFSSVSGGWGNRASSYSSSVSGGVHNEASGHYSSVSGGSKNKASGIYSSVSGGSENRASSSYSSVSGGYDNRAGGEYSSVSGGSTNIATGKWSSVSGGEGHVAAGQGDWAPGLLEEEIDQKITDHSGVPDAHHGRYTDDEAFQAVLDRDGHGSGLDADMVDGLHGSGLDQSAGVAELVDRFQHFSRTGDEVLITGANLHVVNGTGTTEGAPNALGNVIIGYNEERSNPGAVNDRSGSHVLVLGKGNNYKRFGGIVAGEGNEISGDFSSVSGGNGNKATARHSSISGGAANTANGQTSWIGGGIQNTTELEFSSVSGGRENLASGQGSSVCGGYANEASGFCASVSGGFRNEAICPLQDPNNPLPYEGACSVSGGANNQATGRISTVCGGIMNTASGMFATISGGRENQATCTDDPGTSEVFEGACAVSGGYTRSVAGDNDWRAGSLFEDQ